MAEKTFKQLWRELTKEGWKARRPSGLSVDFAYVKQGKGALSTLKRGVDYFEGVEELMAYARKNGMLRNTTHTTPPPGPATRARGTAKRQKDSAPQSPPMTSPSSSLVEQSSALSTPSHSSATLHEEATALEERLPAPAATPAPAAQSCQGKRQARSIPTSPHMSEEDDYEEDSSAASSDSDEPPVQPPARMLSKPTGTDPLDAFDKATFIDAMRADDLFASKPGDADGATGGEPMIDSDAQSDGDSVDDSWIDNSDEELDFDWAELENSDEELDPCGTAVEWGISEQELRGLTWDVYDEAASGSLNLPEADDYYDGHWGPTRSARAFGESPLAMFFYFLPKALWIRIAEETNRYRVDMRDNVAEARRQRALQRRRKDPAVIVPSIDELREELDKARPIQAHEIARFIGLLVARTLCPQRESIARHWTVDSDGVVPNGTFGQVMSRRRFEDIARYLHFSDNFSDSAARDQAWKIRPVLRVLEKTFKRGFRLGPTISFDEGMVPNRSRYNPLRTYMPAKPNKWGIKCYLTCCAVTAYCARIEVVTKNGSGSGDWVGPAAVIRNVERVLEGQPHKRLIVTDNYYSHPALSLKLLKMDLYHVGTMRTNRIGWCKDVMFKWKSVPPGLSKGAYRIAQCHQYPQLVATAWYDSKKVHLIGTGVSTAPTSVTR